MSSVSVGKMSVPDAEAQKGVLLKLVGFSVAMALAPIGSYFASLKYFEGNSTYAAIAAVVVANAVLVGYVTVAFKEEQQDQKERERKAGKRD